ncbi:MAG: M4 family metallopeptidase [Flavobacteriales bacterium]|nr:M4 family metallopeptidase [Flavobacteriales bacterium]
MLVNSYGSGWVDLIGDNPGVDPTQGPELHVVLKNPLGVDIARSSTLDNVLVPPAVELEMESDAWVESSGYVVELRDDDLLGYDLLSTIPVPLASGDTPFAISGTNGVLKSRDQALPALDIFWGLTKTYDYYYQHFGRWSCDGAGGPVIAGYNAPGVLVSLLGPTQNGASYQSSVDRLYFGRGANGEGPYVSLDIVAHEYTHKVIKHTSQLDENTEARALNESFCDIICAAVEFEVLGDSPSVWLIGESPRGVGGLPALRLMNQPWALGHSGTYGDAVWNSALTSNSHYPLTGVQNRWFHLLVNGGSGTHENITYSVDGLSMDIAVHIAYETMINLGPSSRFVDAVNLSISRAEALYPGTNAALEVKRAWHAVGLYSNPISVCSSQVLSGTSGSFSDGSGASDYANGLDCNWLIAPSGAGSISLNFTSFSLASGDMLYVYAGVSTTAPLIGAYTGSTIPANIQHLGSALFVRFVSNATGTSTGWSATYSSGDLLSYCSSAEYPLSAATGLVSDGSGVSSYRANTTCAWYIAPAGATSVTLNFSQFETEETNDIVKIYSSLDTSIPPIVTLSGTALPGPIVSNTGVMFITFSTNGAVNMSGWSASYTSTGSGFCAGSVLSAAAGSIADGSGASSYNNNTHCSWLIQPLGASAVLLNFTSFNLEPVSPEGTLYDRVVVYDGSSAAAPVLGTFAGIAMPPTVISSGPALFVEFITDNATVADGWEATYSSLTGTTCSGTTFLTSTTGAISDGSGTGDYGNNATCNWLIQPEDAVSIQLTFDAFSTQLNADGVIVYDGPSTSSTVLGIYTGSSLPPTLSSSGGSMLVRFVSDAAITGAGFDAHYVANISPAGALALIGYEYWFDEGNATYQSITPTYQYMLDREVDTDGLGAGLHTLHVRFKDNQGSWSSVLSQSFYKALGVPGATPLLAEWEYWFDEAYDDAVVGSLSGTQEVVDAGLESAGLPDGLHTAHMRFRGSGGWSSVLSQSFYKAPSSSSGNATINGYEYWFDDDMGTLVSASVSPTAQFSLTAAMDAADLPNGLHTMHIRFQGDGGWSSVLSQSFFKSGNANSLPNLVDGYRYWFDDQEVDMETVVLNTPLSPYTLNSPINAQGLSVGQHVLHIQFRDLGGSWSSVLSQSFERVATPSVLVPVRMFLEGPFDSGSLLMSDALRAAGLVPTEEPYTGLGFELVGEGGGESTTSAVLSVTGSNAIVDWVFVEVRDNVLNDLVLNTRCALVQRDGDVVDMDGVSPLSMDLAPGNYYIVVRHRNHLGAMTANTAMLNSATGLIDFTSTSVPNYGTEAQKVLAGKKMLWSGNSFHDGLLKYTGASNDRDPILVRIGGIVPTNTVQGYYTEDVTMDGLVKYTGALNDRDPILVNIGGLVPTQVRFEQVP